MNWQPLKDRLQEFRRNPGNTPIIVRIDLTEASFVLLSYRMFVGSNDETCFLNLRDVFAEEPLDFLELVTALEDAADLCDEKLQISPIAEFIPKYPELLKRPGYHAFEAGVIRNMYGAVS